LNHTADIADIDITEDGVRRLDGFRRYSHDLFNGIDDDAQHQGFKTQDDDVLLNRFLGL